MFRLINTRLRWNTHWSLCSRHVQVFSILLFTIGQLHGQNINYIEAVDVDTAGFLNALDSNESEIPEYLLREEKQAFRFAEYKTTVERGGIIWKRILVHNSGDQFLNARIVLGSSGQAKPFDNDTIPISLPSLSDTIVTVPFLLDLTQLQGGTTFSLEAVLISSQREILEEAVSFVQLEEIQRWSFSAELQSSHWLSYESEKKIEIVVKNNGNTRNIYRVQVKNGVNEKVIQEYYVTLNQYSDTVLEAMVPRINSEQISDNRVMVTVFSNGELKKKVLYTHFIDDRYIGHTAFENTPFNLEVGAYNFGTAGQPAFSFRTWGDLHFEEQQQFRYSLNFFNIQADQNSNDLWLYSRLNLGLYLDRGSFVAGDQTVGDFYTEWGRGLVVEGKLGNNNNTLSGGVVNHLFIDRMTYNTTANVKVGNTSIHPTITYSNDETNQVNKLEGSVTAQTNLKNHRLTYGVSLSTKEHLYDSNFFATGSNAFLPDTTLFGAGLRLGYSYNQDGWQIRINSLIRSQYHAGAFAGLQRQRARFSRLLRRDRVSFEYVRDQFSPTEPWNGRLINSNFYDMNRGMLDYHLSLNNFNVTAGLHYWYFELSNTIRPENGQVDAKRYYGSPRIFLRLSSTVDQYRLSAFTQVGPAYLNNVDMASETPSTTVSQVGFNVSKQNATLFMRYNQGMMSPSLVGTNSRTLSNSTSFFIGYRYAKMLVENRIQLNLSANYNNYIEANSSVLNAYAHAVLNLNHGFQFSVFFNFSTVNYRYENAAGSSQFTNAGFRLRKSFDLDQPKQTYRSLHFEVYYDENSNGKFDSTEFKVPDVLVQLKNIAPEQNRGNYTALTSGNGSCFFETIPTGTYKASFTPLGKMNTAKLSGTEYEIILTEDLIEPVGLTQKYRIGGTVSYEKAKYSRMPNIALEKIELEIINPSGEIRTVPVGANGYFNYELKRIEGVYTVRIKASSLPENVTPEKKSFYFDINGFKSYEVNFKLLEVQPEIEYLFENSN